MSDCEGNIGKYSDVDGSIYRIEIEVEFHNTDESQFSLEDSGQTMWNFYAILILLLTLVVVIYKYRQELHQKDRSFSFFHHDQPVILIILCLLLQIISIILQYIHLVYYSYDGKGSHVCELLSLIVGIV